MDDKEIIQLFLDRDENAIRQTDLKYGRLCKGVAAKLLSSHEAAEECVSTTYFKLWNAIPPVVPEKLKEYLLAALKNTAINKIRDEKLFIGSDLDAEISDIVSDEDVQKTAEIKEICALVNKFLGSARKNDRIAFTLRYYYNMPFDKIAQLFSISVNAAQKRVRRLRIRLKKYISDNGYDL